VKATWSQPPKISSITILDSLRPFQLFYNVRTMAPIALPYSQDACRIGSSAFSALGWAESRFGINFFGRHFLHCRRLHRCCLHHLRRIFSPLCISSPPASGNDDHKIILVIIVVCLSSVPAGCHFSLCCCLIIIAIMIVVVILMLLPLLLPLSPLQLRHRRRCCCRHRHHHCRCHCHCLHHCRHYCHHSL
jgi:hypothetical protein